MSSYVERDCVFEHEGRKFEAGGAVVTDDAAVAYLNIGNVTPDSPQQRIGWMLVDWHGRKLGDVESITGWETPRSFVSNRMYQVTARINGIRYTGRSAGEGMIWRGKRTARQ